MLRIPLLDELATVSPGSNIVIEYAAASQWYAASIAIAAGWLEQGGRVSFTALAQSPESIRAGLRQRGVDTLKLESGPTDLEPLRIWDFYTPSLGLKSSEKLTGSLKAADVSILFSRQQFQMKPDPDRLRVTDDWSTYGRFNDEKSWVEFLLTRGLPLARILKSTSLAGLMKGMHSEWVYNRLEAACDGVIDFKVEEIDGEVKNFMRIRLLRNTRFDSRWHLLKFGENFEVTLEK